MNITLIFLMIIAVAIPLVAHNYDLQTIELSKQDSLLDDWNNPESNEVTCILRGFTWINGTSCGSLGDGTNGLSGMVFNNNTLLDDYFVVVGGSGGGYIDPTSYSGLTSGTTFTHYNCFYNSTNCSGDDIKATHIYENGSKTIFYVNGTTQLIFGTIEVKEN